MSNCEQSLHWKYLLTRRQLLQSMAVGAGLLALRSSSDINEINYKEGLIPISNTATFDFVSSYSQAGNVKYSYPETLTRIKQLLGPSYNVPVYEIIQEFGMQAYTENVFKKQVGIKYAEYGAVAGGMLAFASHGKSVTNCQRAFCEEFGYDFIPQAFPVQEGLSICNLHSMDQLGNPSVLLHMSTEPVKRKLAELPYLNIVNISLQFGTLSITHKRRKIQTKLDDSTYQSLEHSLLTFFKKKDDSDYVFYNPDTFFVDEKNEPVLRSFATGKAVTTDMKGYTSVSEEDYEQYIYDKKKEILEMTLTLEEVDTSKSPYYEIQGAYTGEYGADNIQDLFLLVCSFPEKLFIAAAGNYGDDLLPLRALFMDEWPENLLVAGYWDSSLQYPRMFGTYDIFGADIYVDPLPFAHEPGSSMATAVLSGAASILSARGLSFTECKAALLRCCRDVTIERKPSVPSGSTNIEEYIYAELNKTNEVVRVFDEELFDKLFRSIEI